MTIRSSLVSGALFTLAGVVCATAPQAQPAQNPQLVPVLQALLDKYDGCILEKYETPHTQGLQVRDTGVTCMAGNICTLAQRHATFANLQAQARRGDPTNFETQLRSAILTDCMQCAKHGKFHTKHVHCTMECDGNNGISKGPCFEGCKAGVDVTRVLNDIGNEIHGALHNIGIVGPQNTPPATGGVTVSSNRAIVDATDPEKCDASHATDGIFLAPKELLDWTPTNAPQFKVALSGFAPPAPPTIDKYNSPALHNIGANEGRLRADLRSLAAAANPHDDLCSSAAAFASGNTTDGNAFADLAVTGRRAYASFKRQALSEAQLVECMRKNRSLLKANEETLQRAATTALDRAYRVAGMLRAGGWPTACPERAGLGFIAVSGEDDQPHRPVNVPSAEFPQYDLEFSVPRSNGQTPLGVHTRYMIAHTVTPAGGEHASCSTKGRHIPADRAPVLASDAEVILFIHGMDSRAEEAMDLAHAMHKLGRERGKNYTIVSLDLPTSGYADNIDPSTISPLSDTGTAGGGLDGLGFAPKKYSAPVVDFVENFIVSFVNALDKKVPVAGRIRTVVGGSLGGNMSMRLGRPRADAPWVTSVVPWSPAAIWPSFDDDAKTHAALAIPWYFAGGDPAIAPETPGARRALFYGGFDWQSKAFGFIPLGGGRPQAEYWYRDGWECKAAHMRTARIDRYETYNHVFRLWHWRLGMEQLQFSQQIPKPGTTQPLYLGNTKPMLLMCGMQDTGGALCEATREVATKMTYTPGHALFINDTGHSIHNERPTFLARHIADFIEPAVRGITMELDANRMGGDIAEAQVAANPALCRDACQRDTRCRAYTYVRPGTMGSGPRCFLKSSAGTRSTNVDMISGVK